jgi:hypothetical protein
MWQDKLNELVKEKQIYKEEINIGALEKEIQLFKRYVIEELNINLPDEYLSILRTVNGVEFNGFIFYGIDEVLLQKIPNQKINGLIENNKIWHENEWQHQYIFLGESNISWYVYHNEVKKYYELDNPSGREIKEFSCLENMLEKLLSDSLL